MVLLEPISTSMNILSYTDLEKLTQEEFLNLLEEVPAGTESVEEMNTNVYALQNSGGDANTSVSTSVEEIKVFLALNLLTVIKPLPSMRDYWSSRRELRDPFISSRMSRDDRFIWLTRNIHLNDNSVQPRPNKDNFDKLYKMRPMLDILSETFISSYKPPRHQAIDELMIKFKRRSSLRQYMPMKPIKRGYKV
nr:unnamed protein product [Callosobruchus analis]